MGNKSGKPAENKANTDEDLKALKNDLSKAQDFLTKARAERDTNLAKKYYEKSITYFKQAIAESHQSESIQRSYSTALLELGDLFANEKNIEKARSYYDEALRLGHPDAQSRKKNLIQRMQADDKSEEYEDIEEIQDEDEKDQLSPTIYPALNKHIAPFDRQLFESKDQKSYPTIFHSNPILSEEKVKNDELKTTQQLAKRLAHHTARNQKEYAADCKIALEVVEAFAASSIKPNDIIQEVTALAISDEKEITRKLFEAFIQPIKTDVLVSPELLTGLAIVIQEANPAYLDKNDLVQILIELNNKKQSLFDQQSQKFESVLKATTRLLDAMVDCEVSGLSRESLHKPLREALNELKVNDDKKISYLAHYAAQALARVPDDETTFKCVTRHGTALFKGASKLLSAAKNVDAEKLIEGFEHFGEVFKGMEEGMGALQTHLSQAADSLSAAMKNVNISDISDGIAQLKEAKITSEKELTWYDELRFVELLLKGNHFTAFEKYIKQAQGKLEPAYHA